MCRNPSKNVAPHSLGTCPPKSPRHFEALLLLHQEKLIFWRHLILTNYSNNTGVTKNWHMSNWPKRVLGDVIRCPILTNKFQWEVFQIAKKKFPIAMLLGGLSVNNSKILILTILKAKETNKDGCHQVTKKLKKKEIKTHYTCPVQDCKFWKLVKAVVLRHVKEKHPNFRWKCHRCSRSFATKVGHYKHELCHKYGFHYECNKEGCGYHCLFRSEMEEHCCKNTVQLLKRMAQVQERSWL